MLSNFSLLTVVIGITAGAVVYKILPKRRHLFIHYIKTGNIEDIRSMLERENSDYVNSFLIGKKTPLMIAAESGKYAVLQYLIGYKAKLDLKDSSGKTALIFAVESDKAESDKYAILKSLIDHKAKLDLQDSSGKTALMFAVESNQSLSIRALLKGGANTNITNNEGKTALMIAVESNQLLEYEIMMLLDAGADPNIANREGKTALIYAIESNQLLKINILLAAGVDPNIANKEGKTALMIAVELGQSDVVKLLINHKARLDLQDSSGKSVFHYAAQSNTAIESILSTFVKQFYPGYQRQTAAFAFSKDNEGNTAMHCAAESSNSNFVNQWSTFANKNYARSFLLHQFWFLKNNNGETPLMLAAKSGDLPTFKCLVNTYSLSSFLSFFDHRDSHNGQTLLIYAIRSGKSEIVKELLSLSSKVKGGKCMSPTEKDFKQKSPLMYAAELGDFEVFSVVLDSLSDKLKLSSFKEIDKNGKSALMYALESGNCEIISRLLEVGSDLNVPVKQRETELNHAIETGNFDIVKLFLEKDSSDHHLHHTFLRLAVSSNEPKLDMVEKLLELGANTESIDKQGYNALDLACSKLPRSDQSGNNTESQQEPTSEVLAIKWKIILAMLDKGVRLNENGSLLSVVCSTPMLADPREVIQKIIENGSYDPNAKNKEGVTPLMSAISNTGKVANIRDFCDGTDLAKYIIEKVPAINLDIADSNGRTALMAAVSNKNHKAIQMLLDKRARPNIADNEGKTALMIAVESNNVVAINSLLEGGADPNIADTEKKTALMIAVDSENQEVINLLLARHANPNIADKEGKTPLRVAVDSKNQEVTNLLLAREADPNIGDKEGKTPLMVAVSDTLTGKESETLITSLLSSGANPSLLDNHDRDAFFYSVEASREGGFTKLISKYFETKSSPLDKKAIGFIKYLEDIQRYIVSQKNPRNSNSNRILLDNLSKLLNDLYANLSSEEEDSLSGIMNVVAKLRQYSTNKHTTIDFNDSSNLVYLICALLAESQGKQYTDESGKTPLMYAILLGDIGLIESMLDPTRDLSAVDESGKNALMHAAAQGNTAVVNILLESEVDINAVDQSGKTALMIAVDSNNSEVIELLLSKGANPSIVDKDNQTAFDYAKKTEGLNLPELVNRRLTSSSSGGGGYDITFSKLIKKLEEIQSSVISRKTSYLSRLSRENPERDTLLQELKTILNKLYFDVSENPALLDSPGEALLAFCEKPIPQTTQEQLKVIRLLNASLDFPSNIDMGSKFDKFEAHHRDNRLKGLDSNGCEVKVQTAVPLDNCAAEPAVHFVAGTADFQHDGAHYRHTGLPLASVVSDTDISHHGASAVREYGNPLPSAPPQHALEKGRKGGEGGNDDQPREGDADDGGNARVKHP